MVFWFLLYICLMFQTYPISICTRIFLTGICLIGCLFIGNLSVQAQVVNSVEETGILYSKVKHSGLMLHSNGLGINYRRGKHLTGYSYLLGDFALLTMKHPKETKQVNQFSDNNGGFIYGKLNSLLVLRTGIGKQKTINQRGDKGGVEVSWGLYGGASWGLAKPVYLSVYKFDDLNGVTESIEKYNPDKHFPDNIAGRASYFKGFGESKIHPGLYASFLLNFEFGREQQQLRMVETGLAVDAFAKPVPMMAFNTNSNFYFTFFIRLLIGKQWNYHE